MNEDIVSISTAKLAATTGSNQSGELREAADKNSVSCCQRTERPEKQSS